MSYFKNAYILGLLPIVCLIYNLIPKKRYLFLLLVNFAIYFYLVNFRVVFLLVSILSIYFCGLSLNKIDSKKEKLLKKSKEDKKLIEKKIKNDKKLILLFCILLNVSFLIVFKYLSFFTININHLLDFLHINYSVGTAKFLGPLGISFYTLSALSYILDVYNGKIVADKSFVKVALFLSFFPQITEGPIARFSDTADSLYEGKKITNQSFVLGYQRILFGLFKYKLFVPRLNLIVSKVFLDYTNYSGFGIFLGALAYTVMLYMEFSGTMDIVIGSGQIFGVKIPENFRQPFFSKNISEFWTRWHISLGLWFKDYIYYPICLSKPLKKLTKKTRKLLGNQYGPLISGSIALFVVWFLNGLWHGAGYTFLFFGLYHFVMIAGGNFITPLVVFICKKLHINRENIIYRILQTLKMCFFVIIGELFFRVDTLSNGFAMVRKIFTNFVISGSEMLRFGLSIQDYVVIIISLIFIFIMSILREKNIDVREKLSTKKTYVRWIIMYVFILIIIIFGAYGTGYEPIDPIYADF